MAKNWTRERRSFSEYISAVGGGNMAELARDLDIPIQSLYVWLSEPARGFRRDLRIKLRDGLGVPTVAILERNRPIGEVVREEERATREAG